jgi:Holliday junction resolvase RusA-like endonuclease|tara:strand:+ start:358 stop:723 length:366 start_codon:yes stop_codon:yes gene_type:complete
MTKTLTIPGRFPSLNEVLDVAKTHWTKYRDLKLQLTDSVDLTARSQKLHRFKGKVRVDFYWYEENQRRDVDNIRHGAKYILDGLVQGGFIQGDSQKYVVGLRDEFFVDKKNPRVEVAIEDL